MIILLTQGNYSDYHVTSLVNVPDCETKRWLELRDAEEAHKATRPREHFSAGCRGFQREQCDYCGELDRLRANADKAAQDLHSLCKEMLSRNPAHRKGFELVPHLEVRRNA